MILKLKTKICFWPNKYPTISKVTAHIVMNVCIYNIDNLYFIVTIKYVMCSLKLWSKNQVKSIGNGVNHLFWKFIYKEPFEVSNMDCS